MLLVASYSTTTACGANVVYVTVPVADAELLTALVDAMDTFINKKLEWTLLKENETTNED